MLKRLIPSQPSHISRDISGYLRVFKLTKIIPLAALFTVVVVLFVTQTFVSLLGGVLPGRVIYRSEAASIHGAETPTLVRFWAAYPENGDVHMLTLFVEQRIDKWQASDTSILTTRAKRWEEKKETAEAGLNAVKVYIVLSIGYFIFLERFRKWKGWGRLLGVLVLLSLAGVLFVGRQVYSKEQVVYLRGHALDVICSQEKQCHESLDPEKLKQYSMRVQNDPALNQNWWHFQFVSSYPLEWFLQTFWSKRQ